MAECTGPAERWWELKRSAGKEQLAVRGGRRVG